MLGGICSPVSVSESHSPLHSCSVAVAAGHPVAAAQPPGHVLDVILQCFPRLTRQTHATAKGVSQTFRLLYLAK